MRPGLTQVRVTGVTGIDADGKPMPGIPMGDQWVFRSSPSMHATIAADWPFITENESELLLSVQRPKTSRAVPEPTRFTDRQVRYMGHIADGEFLIQAHVSDHVLDVDTVGEGAFEIQAGMKIGEVVATGANAGARQTVIFDQTPPTGELLFSDLTAVSSAYVNSDVRFRVDAQDELTQVTRVKLVRDTQPNDKVDAEDKPVPKPFELQNGVWGLELKFTEPGEMQFFATAEDTAGNRANFGPAQLHIEPVPTRPTTKLKVLVDVVLGNKSLDADASLNTIELSGSGVKGVRSGAHIKFDDVPMGTYKLVLKGYSPSHKKIAAEKEIVVTENGDNVFSIQMDYE